MKLNKGLDGIASIGMIVLGGATAILGLMKAFKNSDADGKYEPGEIAAEKDEAEETEEDSSEESDE